MPLDPTGRYKGTNFDPDYAAKKKAKLEQRHRKGDYDQRPRDNGYNSRYDRDGRGWQASSSVDYGNNGSNYHSNNYAPQRDTHWVNPDDRAYGSSHGYRYNNSYSTPRSQGVSRQYSPTNPPSNAMPRPAPRIPTPPLAATQSDTRDMDATLKDLSNLVGIEPPASFSSGSNPGSGAPLDTSSGPGGELSSLEKLKLFKAQVEASRAIRSTDASSTAVTRVAESFLQRENSGQTNAAEEGEVAEANTAQANDKAQALKAKLKALKQQKIAAPTTTAASASLVNTTASGAQGQVAPANTNSKSTETSPQKALASSTHPSKVSAVRSANGSPTKAVKEPDSTQKPPQQSSEPPRQAQSYADAAREYTRRRSASPRGRASSPVRNSSRPREPLERRINMSDDRYADQPPDHAGPRSRRDEPMRYDRLPNSRETNNLRPTRSAVPPATPLPVSSTSINLVVKTLEVIKAQVEQLEVLIQPMLDAQATAEVSHTSDRRAPQQSPVKEMPPPAAPSYPHQRRSSFDSYEASGPPAYYKRKPSYYDDDDGGYYRSTPMRGGFKKGRGGGRGGKFYNNRDSRDSRDTRDNRS